MTIQEKIILYRDTSIDIFDSTPGDCSFIKTKKGYNMKDYYCQGRKKLAYRAVVLSFMKLLIRDIIAGKYIKTNSRYGLHFFLKTIPLDKAGAMFTKIKWLQNVDVIGNGFNLAIATVKARFNDSNNYFWIEFPNEIRKKIIENLNNGKTYFR